MNAVVAHRLLVACAAAALMTGVDGFGRWTLILSLPPLVYLILTKGDIDLSIPPSRRRALDNLTGYLDAGRDR